MSAETVKNLFQSEKPHIMLGKQMGKEIFELSNEYHSEVVEVIKATLVRMHELEIERIKKI